MQWIVAMTKPGHESIASINLERQGYPYYCPKFLQKNKKPFKPPTPRPLFPRYIFVNIDRIWSPLLGTRGISYVLMSDEGPQSIPEQVIDQLRKREDKNGYVSLTPPSKFTPGDRVKVSGHTIWSGHTLVYEGMTAKERVRALANLFGRQVVVELPEKSLVAA